MVREVVRVERVEGDILHTISIKFCSLVLRNRLTALKYSTQSISPYDQR
jgi:hypothetical protein